MTEASGGVVLMVSGTCRTLAVAAKAWKPVVKGLAVAVGDLVECKPGGTLKLRLPGGAGEASPKGPWPFEVPATPTKRTLPAENLGGRQAAGQPISERVDGFGGSGKGGVVDLPNGVQNFAATSGALESILSIIKTASGVLAKPGSLRSNSDQTLASIDAAGRDLAMVVCRQPLATVLISETTSATVEASLQQVGASSVTEILQPLVERRGCLELGDRAQRAAAAPGAYRAAAPDSQKSDAGRQPVFTMGLAQLMVKSNVSAAQLETGLSRMLGTDSSASDRSRTLALAQLVLTPGVSAQQGDASLFMTGAALEPLRSQTSDQALFQRMRANAHPVGDQQIAEQRVLELALNDAINQAIEALRQSQWQNEVVRPVPPAKNAASAPN